MSGFNVEEHFPVKGKTIEMPNGATKEVIDYKLSRYACYLIVQNASPARHKSVALGQTYFAVQTRKMELTQEEYNKLNEDEKRLYTRINIKNKNKYLFDTAKKAGVNNYAKFNDYGYKGLYGGETAKDIAKRKGIDPDKEEILSLRLVVPHLKNYQHLKNQLKKLKKKNRKKLKVNNYFNFQRNRKVK